MVTDNGRKGRAVVNDKVAGQWRIGLRDRSAKHPRLQFHRRCSRLPLSYTYRGTYGNSDRRSIILSGIEQSIRAASRSSTFSDPAGESLRAPRNWFSSILFPSPSLLFHAHVIFFFLFWIDSRSARATAYCASMLLPSLVRKVDLSRLGLNDAQIRRLRARAKSSRVFGKVSFFSHFRGRMSFYLSRGD